MRQALIAAMLLGAVAAPAAAQDDEFDERLENVEAQLRAVQRQVFPGGGGSQFFEPEIQPAQPGATPGPGATAPIADLTERMSALESRVAELTNQAEENGFRLQQLEQQIEALRAVPAPAPDPDFSQPGAPFEQPAGEEFDPPPEERFDEPAREEFDAFPALPAAEEEAPAESPLPPGAPIGTAGVDPDLPSDPGEAAYVQGYRLWRDGNHAAAQAQLNRTIEEHPGHRFESYARNLLGRSLLDDGKPANAVEVFVANYREIPNGERASDSLFYLGVALTELNYPERACLAFDELGEVYGANLRSDISEQLPAARRAANCG